MKTELHQARWPSAITGDGNGDDPRGVLKVDRKFTRVGQKHLADTADMATLAESLKTGTFKIVHVCQ